jgi:hypothetical protein
MVDKWNNFAFERPLDRECRPHCALGIVLLRDRIAEQGHQSVAQLLGDVAAHRPNQLILSKILVLNLPTAFIASSKCLTDRGCLNVERGGDRQCYRRSPK